MTPPGQGDTGTVPPNMLMAVTLYHCSECGEPFAAGNSYVERAVHGKVGMGIELLVVDAPVVEVICVGCGVLRGDDD